MTVHGVTLASTDTIGTVTLIATKAAMEVEFTSTRSTFMGLIVQAAAGIDVAAGVETTTYPTSMHAGTSTLTIASTKALQTTNQALTITALDIDAVGEIVAGTGQISIHGTTASHTISLGASTGHHMHIVAAEFARTTGTAGLRVGNGVNGSIYVNDFTRPNSNPLGTTTLLASRDDTKILFETKGSTFNALAAQADNGVGLAVSVLADGEVASAGDHVGFLYVNGDYDDAGGLLMGQTPAHDGDDTDNNVVIASAKTITAKTVLTLEGTTGYLTQSGTLTLKGDAGIYISTHGVGTGSHSNPLDMDANTGFLTVAAGKHFANGNGLITITADDFDLVGGIGSGTGATTLLAKTNARTIGLGATPKQMHISGGELKSITATGLTIGSGVNNDISVHGITQKQSNPISDIVSLVATRSGQKVEFITASSTFNALNAVGPSVLVNAVDVTIDVDDLEFDGTTTTNLTDGRTLTAASLITLASSSGSILPVGTLTLAGGAGIIIQDTFTSTGTSGSKPIVMNADTNGDGGTLTVFDSKILTTNANVLWITAYDVDIRASASIKSGTRPVKIHGSTSETIGFGVTAKNMHLVNAELERISAEGFTLGNSVNGVLTTHGVTEQWPIYHRCVFAGSEA
jgi:hypothetical protein